MSEVTQGSRFDEDVANAAMAVTRANELGSVYEHDCLIGTDLVSINVPRCMADGVSRIVKELDRAMKKFSDNSTFRSRHEALGVLREEYIEYETAIFTNQHGYGKNQDCAEAIQLAAMALHHLKDFGNE